MSFILDYNTYVGFRVPRLAFVAMFAQLNCPEQSSLQDDKTIAICNREIGGLDYVYTRTVVLAWRTYDAGRLVIE